LQLQTHANKLGRATYKLRGILEHQVHAEHKAAKNKYQNGIKVTKQQHWRDWLEKVEDLDIWVMHCIVSAPHTDGGRAKILRLKHKVDDEELTVSTNEEKSRALTKCFFPTKLQDQGRNAEVKYPKACRGVGKITREQICEQLRKTKPFKALGPDGISNIVLSNSADLIMDRLFYIYEAMLERGLQYALWKVCGFCRENADRQAHNAQI